MRDSGDAAGQGLQAQAWQWAVTNCASDGSLPSGKQIATQFGRHERWGRLVKRAGIAGQFSTGNLPEAPGSNGAQAPEAITM
jgi:hypothetical protein